MRSVQQVLAATNWAFLSLLQQLNSRFIATNDARPSTYRNEASVSAVFQTRWVGGWKKSMKNEGENNVNKFKSIDYVQIAFECGRIKPKKVGPSGCIENIHFSVYTERRSVCSKVLFVIVGSGSDARMEARMSCSEITQKRKKEEYRSQCAPKLPQKVSWNFEKPFLIITFVIALSDYNQTTEDRRKASKDFVVTFVTACPIRPSVIPQIYPRPQPEDQNQTDRASSGPIAIELYGELLEEFIRKFDNRLL